jgi:hypothetical protein
MVADPAVKLTGAEICAIGPAGWPKFARAESAKTPARRAARAVALSGAGGGATGPSEADTPGGAGQAAPLPFEPLAPRRAGYPTRSSHRADRSACKAAPPRRPRRPCPSPNRRTTARAITKP